MDALAQLLLDLLATMGAHLGCVAGVHQNDRPASFFRFADRHADKLAPRHVHNALAHSAPFVHSHLLRCEVFKHDCLIAIHQLTAALVGEVASTVRYPLMNVGQRLFAMPAFVPLLDIFRRILELLRTLEISFILAVEPWMRAPTSPPKMPAMRPRMTPLHHPLRAGHR
jgi:hypothetical protein